MEVRRRDEYLYWFAANGDARRIGRVVNGVEFGWPARRQLRVVRRLPVHLVDLEGVACQQFAVFHHQAQLFHFGERRLQIGIHSGG